jgi:threonine dehydrogenase-like Zn-dependent dehydrogenase
MRVAEEPNDSSKAPPSVIFCNLPNGPSTLLSTPHFRLSALKQLIVELLNRLRDDSDIADDAHEIHIAAPAGDDVLVEVAGEAGAGDSSQVDAYVEALGADGALEQLNRGDGLLGQVQLLGVGEGFQFAFVLAGGDEQVAVGVGEAVEQDERIRRVPEDQALAALSCVGAGGGGLA